MIRRALAVTALSAALVAGGTGIASAANNTPNPNTHPDITEPLPYCGPGLDWDTWDEPTGLWVRTCLTQPEHFIQVPKAHNPNAKHLWNPFSWFW